MQKEGKLDLREGAKDDYYLRWRNERIYHSDRVHKKSLWTRSFH